MIIIGVTGGVGAGKSEVLAYLADKWQAEVFRLDDIARELQMPGESLYQLMVELGGNDVLDENGRLDRRLFAEKMYRDEELKKQINAAVHPAVRAEAERRIALCEEYGCPLCVIEAALLIEAGYRELCTEFWYVYASKETRRARLKGSRGYSDKLVDRIMASQLSEEEFRKNTDFVLDNDSDFAHMAEQIDRRAGELLHVKVTRRRR